MAESIRWGIVGTGGIAAQFATAMPHAAGGDVVAVASRTAEGAQAFGDRFNTARRHASYEALAADSSVDVVYVAGPHIHGGRGPIAWPVFDGGRVVTVPSRVHDDRRHLGQRVGR